MRPARRRSRWAAATAAVLLLVPSAARAGRQSRTVYYQVTATDGSVRELSAVPASNEGIARVLRITRIEQGQKGLEILSTGPQPLTLVSRGQTYKTDLTWNGQAWVAPRAAAAAATTRPAAGAPRPAGRAEAAAARAAMLELAGKLLTAEDRLAEAGKALAGPATAPAGRAAAAAALDAARGDIRSCLRAVLDAARKLSPAPPPAPPGRPTGEVSAGPAPPANAARGIATPIDRIAALPHRVQVWALPPGDARRAVGVAMAHPEAGPAGGFYYVAYADTTGNGRPDELIARSPLAEARRAGEWTRWRFTTDRRRVFVGKAWTRAETVHYHSEAVRIADWRGLSSRAYISLAPWGVPTRPWGPCCSNLRVWTERR